MSTATVEQVKIKVGDFFVSSWGYDQTNVDFFKVVGLTPSGKSVRVQPWTSKTVESEHSGGPCEYVVPGDSPCSVIDWSEVPEGADYWTREEKKVVREAGVRIHRIRFWGDSASFSLTSYSSASLWSGKPVYQTASGWGH